MKVKGNESESESESEKRQIKSTFSLIKVIWWEKSFKKCFNV